MQIEEIIYAQSFNVGSKSQNASEHGGLKELLRMTDLPCENCRIPSGMKSEQGYTVTVHAASFKK
jgi:hypothetical protein